MKATAKPKQILVIDVGGTHINVVDPIFWTQKDPFLR